MTNQYVRPDAVPTDMGGVGDRLDQRMLDVIELLSHAPLESVTTVLDVGIGKGQLAKWLVEKGKVVTGTGLALDSYDLNQDDLKTHYNIEVVECPADNMPFVDETFDAVVMSHILEHVPNVQTVLQEIRRILKPGGYLFIFVPPHDDYVAGGHVSVGWNVGQLMYILLLNGFNVKTGRFIEYGYNVCAFVAKGDHVLPPLRGDRGDLHILNQAGLLPIPIKSQDQIQDSFLGKIKSINWPYPQHLIFGDASQRMRMLYFMTKLVPHPLKLVIGKLFYHFGRMLIQESRRTIYINPTHLSGR